jgi:asparagine synthase (glutamine-hydrolysing)
VSGIIGIWNRNGEPVDPAVLNRMSRAVAHRGRDGGGEWLSGAVGFACRLDWVTPEETSEAQPSIHPSGAVLVFDGRLDNRDELLAECRGSTVHVRSPDTALVLEIYVRFGDRFAEHLNGDFALALFDPRQQKLFLVRDAMGVRPLYYCQAGSTLLFASEIKALLVHPQVVARPDENQLAELLLGGYPQDNRGLTFFEGIAAAPASHVVSVTPGGLSSRQYWDFPAQPLRRPSFDDYVEEFRHLFDQAVRRRLRSAHPVAVWVSGGLDSSAAFSAAQHVRRAASGAYPPVVGISSTAAPGSPADERALVDELERYLGTTVRRVPLEAGLMDGCEAEMWHTENPRLDVLWSMTQGLQRATQQAGCRVLLTGIGADETLSDQAYLVDMFRRLAWRQIPGHVQEFSRWNTDASPRAIRRDVGRTLLRYHIPNALFPVLRAMRGRTRRHKDMVPWYTRKLRERALRSPAREWAANRPFASAHATSIISFIRNRLYGLKLDLRNKVGALHGLTYAYPYLDRDLVSFLVAIPGEAVVRNGVPKALLREALRGAMPESIIERRWKADFTHVATRGAERDWPQLVSYLQSHHLGVNLGLIDSEQVRRALPQQLEKVRVSLVSAPVWSLTMLFGLELWLQTFFSATLGTGGADEMFVGPNVRQGSIPSNSLGEET